MGAVVCPTPPPTSTFTNTTNKADKADKAHKAHKADKADVNVITLKQFTNQLLEIPRGLNETKDLARVINMLKLQFTCIKNKYNKMKRWKQCLNQKNLSTSDRLFCDSMKQWFHNFQPIDTILEDFRSDAGLLMLDADVSVCRAARNTLSVLNNSSTVSGRKKKTRKPRVGPLLYHPVALKGAAPSTPSTPFSF